MSRCSALKQLFPHLLRASAIANVSPKASDMVHDCKSTKIFNINQVSREKVDLFNFILSNIVPFVKLQKSTYSPSLEFP